MKDEKLTSENIAIACVILFGLMILLALISGLMEVVI
jgi:hypothetical protein